MQKMNGLSTLNRLLGKKVHKDASRSTSNLSKSSTNLDTSSQYKKIIPINMKDAPFEQTFRVTVLLPKNQLYVERIGAKTKLDKLLEDICLAKDLHRHKYEFRHPADNSQVFDNEQTIGEVGLNELRLVLKTETRFNDSFNRFHPDDMMKYKHTVSDSVSSSELSRNSKTILRKSSPYSSSNSLNSLDSSGMGTTTKTTQAPVAPVRKKRAAPRPPSQNSIPEQEAMSSNINVFKEPLSIFPRKNFHVSSPNLYNNNNGYQQQDHHKSNLSINHEHAASGDTVTAENIIKDNNNNINENKISQDQQTQLRQNDLNMNRLNATTYNASNRPTSMYIVSETNNNNNNNTSGSAADKQISYHNSSLQLNRSRTSSESSEIKDLLGVKQSAINLAKKRKAPPAPSPRQHPPSQHPQPPVPSPRTVQEYKESSDDNSSIPEAAQRKSSSRELTPEYNGHFLEPISHKVEIEEETELQRDHKTNVSKVMLNVDHNAQEEVSNGPVSIHIVTPEKSPVSSKSNSPTVSKVMIKHDGPITVIPEVSDSDEDESLVNVYNLKSGKSCVTPDITTNKSEKIVEAIIHNEDVVYGTIRKEELKIQTKSPEKLPEIESSRFDRQPSQNMSTFKPTIEKKEEPETKSNEKVEEVVEQPIKPANTTIIKESDRPQSPLWTYTLPAPPTFADSNRTITDQVTTIGTKYYNDFVSTLDNDTVISDNTTIISDADIKPIIRERKPLEDSFIIGQTNPLFQNQADDQQSKSSAGTDVITSDIEDGYQGDKMKSQMQIESFSKTQETSNTSKRHKTTETHIEEKTLVQEDLKHSTKTIMETKMIQEFTEPKKLETVKLEEEEIVNDFVKTIKENFKLEVKNGFEQEAHVGYDSINEEILRNKSLDLVNESEIVKSSFETTQNLENIRRSSEIIGTPRNLHNRKTNFSRLIVRSDSFHSIGPQHYKNSQKNSINVNPLRSTSFVSLINAQKAENRLCQSMSNNNLYNKKKSSSELSICNSPSLQSLSVIKSILNSSRKNSLQDVEIIETKHIVKENSESPAVPSPSTKNYQNLQEYQSKWKYQGPPKINLTTWSERPKIEVSIKSDNDYKFGGSSTLPRAFKNQQSIQIRNIDNIDSPPNDSQKLNEEQQQNRLPKVLKVEYKKNISPVHLKETIQNEGVSKSVVNIKPRPMSMDAAKLWSQTPVHPLNFHASTTGQALSFNRLQTNHSKFVPVVHGFKLNEISESSNDDVDHHSLQEPVKKVAPIVPQKPNYLRSSSSGDIQKKFRLTTYENRNDPPFGQATLRRTGLKEKILSSDKETESIFGRVVETKPQTMKISQQNRNTFNGTSTVEEKMIERQMSVPTAPPPPPIVKKVVVKKQFSQPDVDTRSQLMDSIKNFNKDSLRKK